MASFSKILKSVVLPFGALLVLAIGLRFVINKAGNSLADRFVPNSAPPSLAAPKRLPHRKSLRPKAAPIPTIAAPQLPPETDADRQVIAQAQQEAGVWAQTSLQTTLKPVPSGKGLVVFEPIATGDAALADFGAGCGRWLHLTVSGQSALGKTPLWGAVYDARLHIGLPNLRLNASQAAQVAAPLGVTHVAVGTLSGNAARCTLTYQLRQVSQNRMVGAPLVIQGSRAQVVAQLPVLGKKLSVQLGLVPDVPASVGANADEVALLGRVPWKARVRIAKEQARSLETLAARVPLACVLWMRSLTGDSDDPRWDQMAAQLVRQAPRNALAWGALGWNTPLLLSKYDAQFAAHLRLFPNNYLLNTAAMNLARMRDRRRAEEKFALQATRCAPGDSFAWSQIGAAMSNRAQDIRQSRYARDIRPDEWTILRRLYGYDLQSSLQATRLEPRDPLLWQQVCEAAAFGSQNALINPAFERGWRLDPHNEQLLSWGLTLYQPRWENDPDRLRRVVQMVVSDDDLFDWLHQDAIDALANSDLMSEGTDVLNRAVARYADKSAHHPNDPMGHYYLAYLSKLNGDHGSQDETAINEFAAYNRLEPYEAETLYERALLLRKHARVPEAETDLKRAIAMRPNYDDALAELADIEDTDHHNAKAAESLYRRAIQYVDDGFYHAQLGLMLLNQNRKPEAVAQAQAAIARGYTRKHELFDRLQIDPKSPQQSPSVF